LDLSAVQTAGRYRIAVAGPAETTSPRFRIGGDGPLYRTALANALSYYGNARDGIDYIPSALRAAPAHLHDQHAMTYLTPHANSTGHFKGDLSPLGVRIDAAGGWFDAGDYLKAVQTESYTTDLLLAGVRDFPSRMGSASSTSDFTAEARFGVEWLLKMWDDSTSTLYYQVGIGNGNAKTVSDHDIWRLPQDDDAYGGTDPCSGPRLPGRSSAPTSPDATRRPSPCASRCSTSRHPRSRSDACSPPSTSTISRTRTRRATCSR
jgi:hypothetical protein